MATRNFVPRSNGEGGIGTSLKRWLNGYFNNLNVDTIATISDTDITTADITTANITTENTTTSNITTANIGTVNMSGAVNQTYTTLASASTVNIGAAAANYISVTGTTTITAFDTIQAGVKRTLLFSDELTLTYNATTMILPTSDNIITVAGDVAVFISEGSGNWRCTGYQRYDGTALTSSNPVAIINETQTSGTAGGTFTSGAWRTRVLNTTLNDDIGITLNSNQITLPAGKYKISAHAPANGVNLHQTRLYNITTSTTDLIGTSEVSANGSGYSFQTHSFIDGMITLTESNIFELQHQCSTTQSINGLGYATTFGISCVYSVIKIEKVG